MPLSESLRGPLIGPVLERLRFCIHKKHYKIRENRKNIRTLSAFGWTIDDQEEILSELEPSQCYKVEKDRDYEEVTNCYFFRQMYEGRKLYIKFSLVIRQYPDGTGDFADIKSLHISDYDDNE